MGSSKRVEADICRRNPERGEMETMQVRKGKEAERMEGERERERDNVRRETGGMMQMS